MLRAGAFRRILRAGQAIVSGAVNFLVFAQRVIVCATIPVC
jgi:hypothetical protein